MIIMALGFCVFNNERTKNYNEARKRILKLMEVASWRADLFAQDKDYPLIFVSAMSSNGTMRKSIMTTDFLALAGPNPVE